MSMRIAGKEVFVQDDYYPVQNDHNPSAALLVEVEEVILQVKAQWEEEIEVAAPVLQKEYRALPSTNSTSNSKSLLVDDQWEEIDLEELEPPKVREEDKIEPVQHPGYLDVFKGVIHSIIGDDSD